LGAPTDRGAHLRAAPHREGISYALDTAAILSFSSDAIEQAAALHAAAGALRDTLGAPVWPALQPLLDEFRLQVEVALGEDQYARARDRGRSQDPTQLLSSVVRSNEGGTVTPIGDLD
jgi:hypothetical protein